MERSTSSELAPLFRRLLEFFFMGEAIKESDIFSVIIGTAGHIDHGKSTLVKALTGIDPDRLPDEKRREMTIDLGFAPLELKTGQRVGIIDVPGHERFIKNMVAGATSIDLVLLIVAADEGPNLQTHEHVTIMSLLELKRGLIVMTKIDRADADFRELVADEVRSTVKGTFLEEAPIHEVSAVTGEGMNELRDRIHEMVVAVPARDTSGVFRMPIQRIFSAKGFGTIVTGVPVSGRLKIGDKLEVLPSGRPGRVRGLQAYKCEVKEIRAGHSSAINVTDLKLDDLHRGMVAATPGYFHPANFVEGRFRYVPDRKVVLKNRTPVKLHSGTAECDGRIVLLDKKELQPGEEGFVQFRLDEPIVTAPGDLFIARLQSPMYTIGGGRFLDTSGRKLRRLREDVTQQLEEKEKGLKNEGSQIETALKGASRKTLNVKDLALLAKVPEKTCSSSLKDLDNKLVHFGGNRFMHQSVFEGTMDALAVQVENYHIKNPLRAGMELLSLRNQAKLETALFEKAIQGLVERETLHLQHDKIKRSSFEIKLSREDGEAASQVEKLIQDTRFSTPRREEIYSRFKYTKERIDKVLGLLIDNGSVVQLKDNVLFHQDAIREATEIITKEIETNGPMEAAKFRTMVDTTRKYVIPLLEHLDKLGITQRVENRRVLRKSSK